MSAKFYGKYRGVVINNIDPLQRGRIIAQVPDVSGLVSNTWALPCVMPNTSRKLGSGLPAVGAAVWMEFEQGDPSHPIWSGCFFGNPAETPPSLRNFQ